MRFLDILEIITCDPSIYTMNHPDFTVSSFMGIFIGPRRVKASNPLLTENVQINTLAKIRDPAEMQQYKLDPYITVGCLPG